MISSVLKEYAADSASRLILITLATLISSCSSMSPEARESIQDFRGSLPKFLRGDAVPLEEQPMPNLSGSWTDNDFTQLKIKVAQSGSKLTINRDGDRQGVIVRERLDLSLSGRAIKGKFVNNNPNQIRPTSGSCVGATSKASDAIRLTCDYAGKTFPVNLLKGN